MARKRVTQGVVAYELDMTQQAVSRRLTGAVPFDVDELVAVARLLGVDIADLLPREAAAQ